MPKLNFLYTMTATTALLMVCIGMYQLIRSGAPSADVVAAMHITHPTINVSDFAPGDVEVVLLSGTPIIVWRRDEADKILAASQNNPSEWVHKHSLVIGQSEPLFADDANLTLNGEWFFALARSARPGSFANVPILRSGDFDGFFEGHYATHYDVSGRYRRGYPDSNMIVLKGEFVHDQKRIQLDLSGIRK